MTKFTAITEKEFILNSAINPALFKETIKLVSDIEFTEWGDTETPIHDALNWRYVRFGHQVKENLCAALFINEEGTCWQAKLSKPKMDEKKGKERKYETPVGNGSRAFLPKLPREIREKISQRHEIDVPLEGSFWEWLEKHPEIPVTWTEGGKKALSLLSQGYVAIALYGVNGGYTTKDEFGGKISPKLIPDVARFVGGGRCHVLAFDQDDKKVTKIKVNNALAKFGYLFAKGRDRVSVALWDGKDGKGVDDLIVNVGPNAWDKAYEEATELAEWEIGRRFEKRLDYTPNIRLNVCDLSDVSLPDLLPKKGIIGIASGKGTGKTKLIKELCSSDGKVLSLGHRIALVRNACKRLGLNYRGDLDKVDGDFITGCAYTFTIGTCIDSLLSINPEKFRGCTLIIDEVVQVVRHLLTSSTCNTGGKRPALIARFSELVAVSKLVLASDADLDKQTLHYLQSLRGEVNSEVFLVLNDYQCNNYEARVIESNNRNAIVEDLLESISKQETGKVIYVATDSKGLTKTVAKIVKNKYPSKRILLINSETSGGEAEREFIEKPDTVLARGKYDLVITSPSMATGVSIEIQGIISQVYGIFTGVSSTDADVLQALARVRENVERVVWCNRVGRNYCKVSRSTNPLQIKVQLKERTDATVSLIRSNLRADTRVSVETYDWQSDPHLNLYCQISADQNYAMQHFRDAVIFRLKHEGHKVIEESRESNSSTKILLQEAAREVKKMDALDVANARDIELVEYLELSNQEAVNPEDRLSVRKFAIKDFYKIEEVTVEDVLRYKEGRDAAKILDLEALLYKDISIDTTVASLEKQAIWNRSLCPWDISGKELRRALREGLGLNDFLNPDREWYPKDYKPYADKIRQYRAQIKTIFSLEISDKMSDVQVVNQMLSQFGLKMSKRWDRKLPGMGGKAVPIRRINAEEWEYFMEVIARRRECRIQGETDVLPLGLNINKPRGLTSIKPLPEVENSLDEYKGTVEDNPTVVQLNLDLEGLPPDRGKLAS